MFIIFIGDYFTGIGSWTLNVNNIPMSRDKNNDPTTLVFGRVAKSITWVNTAGYQGHRLFDLTDSQKVNVRTGNNLIMYYYYYYPCGLLLFRP